jgi:hypothetical protein
VLGGHLERADVPGFCAHVCGLLADCTVDPVVCDVGAIEAPDAVTLDALARLQLGAGRAGRRVVLRHASSELRALLGLTGLGTAVPLVGLADPDPR